MTIYEQFKHLPVNPAAIGFGFGESCPYYCTPKNAVILGWAGVDGIHYCTIPDFGEMIFVVSPMDLGDCVHPIARNFEDLLRLLLGCVDMAALEQLYAWDEEQYKAFLIDCPATPEQLLVLNAIQANFAIEPMEDVFSYVKSLQAEFDLTKIPYTEDYYDENMNPAAPPAQPPAWKVTYNGSFWYSEGNAGTEIPVHKHFDWGKEKWYIPSVYLCDKGIVIDYFLEADPVEIKKFIDKWDIYNENQHRFTQEQQEQIRREHPLNVDFHGHVLFNEQKLYQEHGCGLTWLTDFCLPGCSQHDTETQYVLEHYGLDTNRAWSIQRYCYRWGEVNSLEMHSLSVHLERRRENITADHFLTPAVGERIELHHPLTGNIYTLTVHEAEQQELSANTFGDSNNEYPTHMATISYSLEPEVDRRGFMVQDCADSDRPRQKKSSQNEFESMSVTAAASVGIIGGADGPTSIMITPRASKQHAACSSLHFEPVQNVEWRAVFCEKLMDDVEVRLI